MKENVDVVVIGGGISGLAVSKVAASAGYSVALYEKSKIAQGTSANSLRIIHGGLRYLQSFDVLRSVESICSQRDLFKEYASQVSPLPCIYPLNNKGLKRPSLAKIGAFGYSVLQKMLGVPNPKSRVIARSEAVQLLPALEEYSFTHALYWEDGLVTCPDELANVLKREIEDSGGEVFEDCQVNSVSRCDGGFLTKVNSVKDFTRKSKFVLNLSGIGSNEIELLQIKRSPFPRFWCRAFNLEIEQLIDPKVALGVQSPSGRLFFVVPRGSRSVIGTGYLPFDQGASQLALSEKEISGFLSDFNAAFPGKTFASSDVSSIDIGLLPASRIDEGEVALYGAKKVFEDRGYFEVMSTKYTTFLSQANALVQRVNKLATEVR